MKGEEKCKINFLWDDESYSWSVDWKEVDNNDTVNSLQKNKEPLVIFGLQLVKMLKRN